MYFNALRCLGSTGAVQGEMESVGVSLILRTHYKGTFARNRWRPAVECFGFVKRDGGVGVTSQFLWASFFVLCLLVPFARPFSTGLIPSQALPLFLYKGFRKLALGARKARAWTVQMIFACFLFLQLMKLSFHLNAITVWSVNINRGSVVIYVYYVY